MAQSLPIEKLEELNKSLPIKLDDYERWISEPSDAAPVMYSVGSCNAKVRKLSEWNELGREIYDAQDIREHAQAVVRILRGLVEGEFIAQQARNDALWFRGLKSVDKQAVNLRVALLRLTEAAPDFSSWRGGFLFDEEEIESFGTAFIDYAYMFNYIDVEIISRQEPLILTFDHHLCVQYTSTNAVLIDRMRNRIVDEGILEFPERQ